MKKTLINLFSVLLVFTVSAHAQYLDEILENHFKAIGQETMVNIQTQLINVRIIIFAQGMEMEMPLIMKMKRPNKIRQEIDMQGQMIITGYDGKNGWMINPMVGPEPQDLAGIELEQLLEQSDFDGALYNWEEKGHTVEYVGTEDMEGTEVYKLKLTKENGNIIYYYLNIDTYILLKQTTIADVMGTETETNIIFGNYKMVNDIAVPYSLDIQSMNQTIQMVVDTIEFDVELNDSIFVRPVKKEE